jgi:histidine triad (HIT) family protein
MILKEDCIFCKIVGKKIPADIIKETAHFIVIKDINPVAPVHLLIISKRHYDSVLDIKDENKNGLLRCARNDEDAIRNDGNEYWWGGGSEIFGLLGALAEEFKAADKGFRTVINTGEDGGQTVNHLHIHFMAGRGFGWPPG